MLLHNNYGKLLCQGDTVQINDKDIWAETAHFLAKWYIIVPLKQVKNVTEFYRYFSAVSDSKPKLNKNW